MLLVCYEIGTNLFVAILLLVIVMWLTLITNIVLKYCVECKKIDQECSNRELMYLKSNVYAIDGKYKVEVTEIENNKKYDISIKKNVEEKDDK